MQQTEWLNTRRVPSDLHDAVLRGLNSVTESLASAKYEQVDLAMDKLVFLLDLENDYSVFLPQTEELAVMLSALGVPAKLVETVKADIAPGTARVLYFHSKIAGVFSVGLHVTTQIGDLSAFADKTLALGFPSGVKGN